MIRIGTIEEAHEIFMKIPELDQYLSLKEMETRLAANYLILVAESKNDLVGFKLGYPQSQVEFYSWLGGVAPEHRNLGVAQQLLSYQEEWAKKSGFRKISTKSMNRFPAMLRLLIKNGYAIESVDFYGSATSERIRLTKALS